MEAHRAGPGDQEDAGDILAPEWAALARPLQAPGGPDFLLRAAPPPPGLAGVVEEVVLAERLREVRALIGFSRIDPPEEGQAVAGGALPRAPLARQSPLWVPCAETRGEGVFIRLRESAIAAWEQRAADFAAAGQAGGGPRALAPAPRPGPGGGLARAPLCAPALPGPRPDTPYARSQSSAATAPPTSAKRVYARSPGAGPGGEAMAGVLLYTAAADSEGTLGGLVSLGEPGTLAELCARALESAALCSSDPMCAEHDPRDDGSLHGAACHACLFASETSCERGNAYLDRGSLVETLAGLGLGIFAPPGA